MLNNPPDGYHTITPQIVVSDARATIDFLQDVFGAEIKELYQDGDRVIHAEMRVGDSLVFVAGANEEFGVFPAMLNVYVDDADSTYARALSAGGTSLREPEDQFYGDRTSGVLDPQGNQWWISTHLEDVSEDAMRRRMAEMSG
jgi:uncharacterized glyoxalase superfamily protein PhnB